MEELQAILDRLGEMDAQMLMEEKVYQEELADRLRLGLQGEAAVKHYNDWMVRHNMQHLQVDNQ